MTAERLNRPENRFELTRSFASALPPDSKEKTRLVNAITNVHQTQDARAILNERLKLAVMPSCAAFENAAGDLHEAQFTVREYSGIRNHNWDRDRHLPLSVIVARFRVEFGNYAASHLWVSRVPGIRSLPLSEIPQLAAAKANEEQKLQKFQAAFASYNYAQTQTQAEFEPKIRDAEEKVRVAQAGLRSAVQDVFGSSRGYVRLYATFFPNELMLAAEVYARRNADSPEEITRLKITFVNLVRQQAIEGRKTGEGKIDEEKLAANLIKRVGTRYGQWLFDIGNYAPLADPNGRKLWEEFVAYDVANECFLQNPEHFSHQPRPPRLV